MAAPRIPFSKLDPARVSYRQDKGTYRIREGFVKTSTGHLDYRNFDLGADEIDARDRASKIRRLWSDLQSKGGKVWTPEALEVAEAIRMGKAEIVVEKTQAAGTSMDGCNPNDQIAEAYTQHRADKLANPVLPVRISRPVTATATSGQTLFAAIDDFAAWIRQHPNYQTKTERVEDSILSDWGGNLAKSVQRLKSGQSDMPLEYFDLNAIEQIAAYWKGRPYRKGTTRRISIDTVFDQLSSLKRFCKWCHRSSAHVWRKPEDLDDDVFTVKRDTLKTAAEKASAGAGVPVFNRDELCTIWKYATQWEKLFIILGLNCGFAQAEAISLRLNEITLEGEPPTIKRIRIKSGVCPTMVVGKLSLEQKRQLALELNLCRRQVGLPAKKQVAQVLLRRSPFLSDRLIARQSGLDHKTVGVIRVELQEGGEIPRLSIREGRDQKRYRHPRITANTDQDVKRAKRALQALGESATNRPMELRCAERKAREQKMAADRDRPIVVPASGEDFQLHHCGIQELKISEDSVDLVMTDPPYPKEFLHVWDDLGRFAAKVLRPGGMLVTYTGHIYLDQVMAALGRHLTYYWQFVLLHDGSRQPVHDRHVMTLYKPILCYQKGPITAGPWIDDVLIGSGKEKSLHEWQQSVGEVMHCIERLTAPGSLIVDPFGGSFTTAEAVLRVGQRRFIGCDVDRACIVRGQERLAKVREELLQSRKDAHTPPGQVGGV